jgi:hypothetical protein
VGAGEDAANGHEDDIDIDERMSSSALDARVLKILEMLLNGSRSAAGHRAAPSSKLKSTARFRAIALYKIELSQATEARYFDAVALGKNPCSNPSNH